MKRSVKYVYILCSLLLLGYIIYQTPNIPDALDDSIRSYEPADVESDLRRGYYTNYGRSETLFHYQKKFILFKKLPNSIFNFRLNYPPEESQWLIRDQTRSTFLEEIVHPMRESIYISGFEPQKDKDKIIIDGVSWRQKVIIRYVQSTIIARIAIALSVLSLIPIIVKYWLNILNEFRLNIKRIWI